MKTIQVLNFKINNTKTFNELVDEGNYDWKNADVTSGNFPLPEDFKTSELVGQIFDFGDSNNDSIECVEKKMEMAGFRPATSTELLAFAIAYPEVQRNFPIIAMGSVHSALYENSTCLCLYHCSPQRVTGQRGLGVHYYVYGRREKNLHALGVKEFDSNQESQKNFSFLKWITKLIKKFK